MITCVIDVDMFVLCLFFLHQDMCKRVIDVESSQKGKSHVQACKQRKPPSLLEGNPQLSSFTVILMKELLEHSSMKKQLHRAKSQSLLFLVLSATLFETSLPFAPSSSALS